MMNMQNMMRQAQKLQKQMEQSQAELAATEFCWNFCPKPCNCYTNRRQESYKN